MTDEQNLILYYFVPSRGATARWMLEEVGAPYGVRLLDHRKGEHRQPAYLTVNPMGKVPALVHDGAVITETAAICCYLADAFPEAGLTVPIGDPRRGPYIKWLFFAPACLEPAIVDRILKREPVRETMLAYGNFDKLLDVVAAALTPGPYLLGEAFTAADLMIGACVLWGLQMEAIDPRPEFVGYAERLKARPALRRAAEADKALAAGQG